MSVQVQPHDEEQERTASGTTEIGYRCPLCEQVYDHEYLTRIHITRSDDDAHRNHDGLMPETEIEAINDKGNVIETVSRHPDEINVSELDVSHFPDEFDLRKRRVLLIAAYSPYTDSFQELHERATRVLKANDLEPVSYSTVRNWVTDFYLSEREEADEDESASQESLGDLTETQQAVIVHRLADPDATQREIANRAGCADTYPYHVYDRAGELIERLEAELDEGATLDVLLERELDEDEYSRLRAAGHLLPENSENTSDDPGADDSESDAVDGPVTSEEARIFSAGPTFSLFDHGEEPDDASDEPGVPPADVKDEDVSLEQPVDDVKTQTNGYTDTDADSQAGAAESEQTIAKSDLESLATQVSFLRRMAEREIELAEAVNGQTRTQYVITSEIEAELDKLLKS